MLHDQLPCAGCGLVCDDLCLNLPGAGGVPVTTTCGRAATFYREAWVSATQAMPLVDGASSDWPTAIGLARQILDISSRLWVTGLEVDAGTMRAALLLAEQRGATVLPDSVHSTDQLNLARQSAGWVGTTFSEARKRADCVIVLGSEIWDALPRFSERLLTVDSSGRLAPAHRHVFTVTSDARISDSVGGQLQRLGCYHHPIEHAEECLADALAELRFAFSKPTTGTISGGWLALAKQLQRSDYPVFIWEEGELSRRAGLAAILQLAGLVADLQLNRRAALLPCSASTGPGTAALVAQWTSGLRPPFLYSPGGPSLLTTDDQKWEPPSAGDAEIWLQTVGERRTPMETAAARIIVSPYPPPVRMSPREIYLPCSQPGIDGNGVVTRSDGSAALRLTSLRPSERRPASQLIDELSVRTAERPTISIVGQQKREKGKDA